MTLPLFTLVLLRVSASVNECNREYRCWYKASSGAGSGAVANLVKSRCSGPRPGVVRFFRSLRPLVESGRVSLLASGGGTCESQRMGLGRGAAAWRTMSTGQEVSMIRIQYTMIHVGM